MAVEIRMTISDDAAALLQAVMEAMGSSRLSDAGKALLNAAGAGFAHRRTSQIAVPGGVVGFQTAVDNNVSAVETASRRLPDGFQTASRRVSLCF